MDASRDAPLWPSNTRPVFVVYKDVVSSNQERRVTRDPEYRVQHLICFSLDKEGLAGGMPAARLSRFVVWSFPISLLYYCLACAPLRQGYL